MRAYIWKYLQRKVNSHFHTPPLRSCCCFCTGRLPLALTEEGRRAPFSTAGCGFKRCVRITTLREGTTLVVP